MTQEEWLRDVEAQFFDVITKSDGLQELTDYAYTLLQNPIMVSNERGEFLAKPAQNRPYGDALWEEFDLKGYIPREKRSKMSTVYFKSQMRNDRIVILDKHYISHRLMVYQTELAGRFLLRGLLLESKRPFTKLDEQVFERFVRVAAYHVQDSEMVRNFRRDTFEYFLFELIHDRIDSAANEAEIAGYMDLEEGWELSLLAAKVVESSAVPIGLAEARAGLEEIFPNSISVIDGELLLLFLRKGHWGVENLRRAQRFLRKNNLCGCISRPFANMKDIAPYYRQNAQALDLALRLDAGASLHFFSDLFSAYMLRQLPPEGLNFLCYPPLFALLERDKQQGSCLVQSLYAYALCFGSCARAARLLGIHYNSMKSRLEQVRRELGPHLEELLPAVYLSVKALLLTQGESVADCRGLEDQLGSRGEGVDLS